MREFLLWDHDGVLVDTERWYFVATQECLHGLGIGLSQETYLEFMAEGRSCWDLARQADIPGTAIAIAKKRRDLLYQTFLREKEIDMPGIVDVLGRLRGLYRMAVVTTARREDLEVIHRDRRLLAFFDFVITIEDCSHAKPHPAPYLAALRRFGSDPRQALAIEDSSRGLQSAVSAGLDCVIVRNDFTAAQNFAKAWKVIPSIEDLPRAIAAPAAVAR
jgi:HAD superfamily hydrolase (TIGR01509 family)